jgi:hypothetical protein
MNESPARTTAPIGTAAALSVVLVAGSGLPGIARTMRHLRAQTARHRIELLVVAESARTVDAGALDGGVFAACRVIEVGPIRQRGTAAAEGIRAATAPVVAMIEDHSYPEPEWAEAFLRAHDGPWTVVGPAVANANPEYVASWVNYALTYGIFAPPLAAGERDRLPWHNSAYKREALVPFSDRLGALLEWEGSLQDELRASGHTLYLEPAARTHHANVSRGWSTLGLNVQRGRIMGAQRAVREQWPYWRRVVQAAAFPLFPLLQLRHTLPALRRMSMPDALRPRVYAGVGVALGVLAAAEAWGLLAGEGNAMSRMEDYELQRTKHLSRRERRDLDAGGRAMAGAG